jgi:protein phosphatase
MTTGGDERYDVIGDVHGCVPALGSLCDRLGYDSGYRHAEGRKLVFVGDIADRGPDSIGALKLIASLVESGLALNVLGNHDWALYTHLTDNSQEVEGSTRQTVALIESQPDSESLKQRLARLFAATPLLLKLDGGRLIVAHAGVEPDMLDRPLDDQSVRFILNGDAIGKSPEGKTLRRDWAADYAGDAFIVYGHTPQETPLVRANSANIDTGAYRKRALTALRWPEREIVSVEANW